MDTDDSTTATDERIQKFFTDRHDEILQEWTAKIKEVLTISGEKDVEYDVLRDFPPTWWHEVVDQGWEPEIVTGSFSEEEIYGSDVLGLLGDRIIDEAADLLGLPKEIFDL